MAIPSYTEMVRFFLAVGGLLGLCLWLQGCHRANSNPLEGEWILHSPLFGQGTIQFEGNRYTQRQGPGNFTIQSTGTFTLANNTLTLQPTNVNIGGDEGAFSVSMYKNMKNLSTAVFETTFSGPDLVYLTLSDSNANGSASMVMALSRNGAKPDPKKVQFSFEAHGGPGGWRNVTRFPDSGVVNPARPGGTQIEVMPRSPAQPAQPQPTPTQEPAQEQTAPPQPAVDTTPQNPQSQPDKNPAQPAQPDPNQPMPTPDPNQPPQPTPTTGGG